MPMSWFCREKFEHRQKSFLKMASIIAGLVLCAGQAHAAAIATVTTLTASPTASTFGTPVRVTVTVTAGGAPVTTGGQVAICSGATYACSPHEALTTLQLKADGTASAYIYGNGNEYMQASFSGTVQYAKSYSDSYSSVVTFTNVNVPTVTELSSSGSAGAYTLNATVINILYPSASPFFVNEPVSFIDTSNGNNVIGTAVHGSQLSTYGLAPSSTPDAGTEPDFVASADFNDDGYTDIVVSNHASGTVSLLLCQGGGTFAAPVAINTGNGPGPIVTGDFNADGKQDFAVINQTDKTIGVYLGNGDGTFAAPTTIATGNGPNAIAVGDIDGNGSLDLAVLNHDDQTIGVLLNNGAGAFAAQVTYATGNDPRSISIGDKNEDTFADIAVANFADNTIGILLGNGDGTLQAQTTTPTGNGPIAVIMGDFADAGHTSLAYLNYTDSTMTVLATDYGNTTHNNTYATGPNPVAFAFGFHFGGEYSPTPAVLNSDGSLSIFQGQYTYDGTYNPTPVTMNANAGASSLVMGSFNADTSPDVFVGGSATVAPSVFVHLDMYTTSYTLSNVSVPGSSQSSVVARYDGDTSFVGSTSAPVVLDDTAIVTTADIVLSPNHGVAPGDTDTLNVTITPATVGNYIAGGTVTFKDGSTAVCADVQVVNGAASCTTGPLNIAQHKFSAVYSGDTYFAGSTTPTRPLNVSNVTTTALTLSTSSAEVGTIVTATAVITDVNGAVLGGTVNFCEYSATYPACSGGLLLASTQVQTNAGTSPGSAIVKLTLPVGTHNVIAVYGGTIPDAVSTSATQSLTVTASSAKLATVTTLANSGSAGNYTLTATIGAPQKVAITGTVSFTDTKNSGYTPRTASAGSLSTSTSLLSTVNYPYKDYDMYAEYVTDMKTGDFNGDGIPDVAYSNSLAGAIGVRLGNGDGTLGAEINYQSDSDNNGFPRSLAVADLNGDGKLDVAVVHDYGHLGILLGNGDGTFPSVPTHIYDIDSTLNTYPYSSGAYSVAIGDFNADGYADIAVGTAEGTIYILLGNGDGSFQTPTMLSNFSTTDGGTVYITSLTARDMNGDGNLDLVFTHGFNAVIRVMLGNGDGTFQNSIDSWNIGTDNAVYGSGLDIADVNRDGKLDVVASWSDDTVSVMLGKGDGTFQDGVDYATGQVPTTVVLKDMNGDGILDAVVGLNGFNGTGISILIGKANGTFNNQTRYSLGAQNLGMAVADFGRDGTPDVVISNNYDSRISLANAMWTTTAKVTGVSFPGATASSAHSAVATYPGDSTHLSSVSNARALAGTKIGTTVTLGSSPSSGVGYGSNVMLTALMSPSVTSGYNQTGNVTFMDGTTALTTSAAISAGSATYMYQPEIGTHSFTASYAGDTNFNGNTSSAMDYTVVQGTPVITWNPASNQGYVGIAIGAAVLNASSSVDGTISYTATPDGGSPVAVTAVSQLAAGHYTLTATATPTDSTHYSSASSDVPFTVSAETIWVLNGDGTFSMLNADGTAQSVSSKPGAGNAVVFTSEGNAWMPLTASNSLAAFDATGAVLSGSPFSGGGLNQPKGVAVDGFNTVWAVNGNGTLSRFIPNGAAISPSGGYVYSEINNPSGIAIDISGNIWISNQGDNSVTEIIGGAPPTQPIAIGTRDASLGVRP